MRDLGNQNNYLFTQLDGRVVRAEMVVMSANCCELFVNGDNDVKDSEESWHVAANKETPAFR